MTKERVTAEGFEFDLQNPHEGCWIVTSPVYRGFFMNEKTREQALERAPKTWRWFVGVCREMGVELGGEG